MGVISIPSGAIKSVEEGNNLFVSAISIPSGAIKSLSAQSFFYSILQPFQFLLVRLRDMTIETLRNANITISIPSGAIKSVPCKVSHISLNLVFQFLLVRLRDKP